MLACGTARPYQRLPTTSLPALGFQAWTPADHDGPTPPPAGSPAIFMRHRDTELANQGPDRPVLDVLEIGAMDVDWDTPANTTFTQLPDILTSDFDSNTCNYLSWSCAPQPVTSARLDPLMEVIMYRLAYRNFGTHESMVGVLTVDVNGADHLGERWFEVRKAGAGNWTLYQEGTYAPDSEHRFMGTIGMDGSGNILLGYALSSTSTSPSVRYTGRQAGDPLGTMPEPEQNLIAGSGYLSNSRYGDYSQMGIDPADDCTFWFTVERTEGNNNNTTQIGRVHFTACTPILFADGFESTDTSVWTATIDEPSAGL
jgi:hypothetical protein